jgi:ABC-2 type transport system permease protein
VIIVSGVFYDVKHTPTFLRDIAEALPLKNAIDGLTGALVNGHGIGHNASSLAVIALWGAFGVVLAVRGFSWEQTRQ